MPIPMRIWARSPTLGLLRHEVAAAKEELQALLDRPVRYFAFPFGQHRNLSLAVFESAKAAGYAGVCSAYGGFNFPGDDPFHLQRIPADGSLIQLKNWVTMDPRKLRTQRFVYRETGDRGQGSGSGVGIRDWGSGIRPLRTTGLFSLREKIEWVGDVDVKHHGVASDP